MHLNWKTLIKTLEMWIENEDDEGEYEENGKNEEPKKYTQKNKINSRTPTPMMG